MKATHIQKTDIKKCWKHPNTYCWSAWVCNDKYNVIFVYFVNVLYYLVKQGAQIADDEMYTGFVCFLLY